MRSLLRSVFAFIALVVFPASAFAVYTPPASFADLVEKLSPAVVNVYTTQKVKGVELPEGMDLPNTPEFAPFRQFFEQFNKQNGQGGKDEPEQEVTSLGSGFIIDPSGYIVTNYHVVAKADDVSVRLSDDTKLSAKVIGRDEKTDLALLKVESKKPLPYVPLGDSDKVRVGDWVICVGNPFGLGGTVTAGIISARARHIGEGAYDDFFQTDAAINRGNSGGPMFNTRGEVIGVNSAIFSPNGGSIGIGFAIPSNLTKSVITQLREHGKIRRGWLGVKIQTVTDEIADSLGMKTPHGALVLEVSKDSPADKAGMKVGDVIVRFDGQDVKEMRTLPRMVADTKIGKQVGVDVLRKGGVKHLAVTLGELKDEEDTGKTGKSGSLDKSLKGKPVLGMSLAPLTDALRDHFNLDSNAKGVVVTGVEGGSKAAERGIEPGDLITRLNDRDVAAVQDVESGIREAKTAGRKYVLLQVKRGDDSQFVTLPLGGGK
jgi:serine protease Do